MTKETLSPMQQELLSRADTIFNKISEAASKAYDVAAEQLPDIAYQFIAYNRVYLTSVIAIVVLLEIALTLTTYKFIKLSWDMEHKPRNQFIDYTGFSFLFGLITTLYTLFVFLTTMLATFKPFIMVWFAPKLFLITEIIKLVK